MWTCPKCGRSFRNCNQSHYCGKAPQTIEEYILGRPEEVQPILRQLQEAIHAAIPEAKEKISWSMPTFWKGRNLIQFAASQKHIGLYPGPEAVEAFADRLTAFSTSKGTNPSAAEPAHAAGADCRHRPVVRRCLREIG